MFWDKWIPARLLIKPLVCGIEALVGEEGTTWYYTLLKKQGSQLSVLEQGSCVDPAALPRQITKDKIPVLLCINGRGIMTRKLVLQEDEDLGSLEVLQQHLPGLSLQDFNIQLFMQDNRTCFAAVQRREHTDTVIRQLNSAVPVIADVFIGPATVLAVGGLLQGYNYVQGNLCRVELLNGYVDQLSPAPPPDNGASTDLGGLQVDAPHLFAVAAAFAYLTGQQLYRSVDPALGHFRQQHLENNKFRLVFLSLLSLAFLLCLVNFFIFTLRFEKNKKLDAELGLYQDKYDKINDLLTAYEKKKNLIEETGLLENYFFAQYTDKIAATLPEEVLLTDYQFNPKVETDFSEDSLMNFRKRTIIVRGNCTKSLLINEWVNVLKSQNFIKDVNLEKFLFNADGNQPNFELRITTE